MNHSAEQTNRPRTASWFTRFVCPALRFISHEPRKKYTHSLIVYGNIHCTCWYIVPSGLYNVTISKSICVDFVSFIDYFSVGCLVVLRINVDFIQPYLDLEAGYNQSLKIQVARWGIEPRSSCSASQELNHSANAAPITFQCTM